MKNQYFGDVNDYRKYGLLRCLSGGGSVSIGICWMLTPDDSRSDGGLIGYLSAPQEWRPYDPPLFDALQQDVHVLGRRDVRLIESSGLISGATFHSAYVPTDKQGRAGYISQILEQLGTSQLIFFDPDNGIEVQSVPFGSRNSPKYVYWRELVAAFNSGHSPLIYQHYPRQARTAFHLRMGTEIHRRMPDAEVYALRTAGVVYLLLIRPEHTASLQKSLALLDRSWSRQIVPERLVPQ